MSRTFKWQWPDGDTIIAKRVSEEYIKQLNDKIICPSHLDGHHKTHVMFDITQWGMWGHKWLAVHRCEYCKLMWACTGVDEYELGEAYPF